MNQNEKMLYETQGQFQRALGCGKSTMSRYLDRDDWPLRRVGPWKAGDLVIAQQWREGLQEDRNFYHADEPCEVEFTGHEPLDDLPDGELRRRKLIGENQRLRIAIARERAELNRVREGLIDAGEVKREWTRITGIVRNVLGDLPSQLLPIARASGLPDESSAAFQRAVVDAVAGVLGHLEDGNRMRAG